MDRPSGEFFRTLGQYVYGYKDPDSDEWIYIGKGNGDRCWFSGASRGYDPEHCFIIATNLERFDKSDWQSFILESYLISKKTPRDNTVSGHYKDCFIMKSLSSLFSAHINEQRDMFMELVELVDNNKKVFEGRVGLTESRQSSYYIESRMRENIYLGIKVDLSNLRISLKCNKGGEDFRKMKRGLQSILEGRKLQEGSNTVSFFVDTMEEVLQFWTEFHS